MRVTESVDPSSSTFIIYSPKSHEPYEFEKEAVVKTNPAVIGILQ